MDNPDFWRSRAEEVRAIVWEMKDRHSKAIMDRIADDYECFAQHSEQRRRSQKD